MLTEVYTLNEFLGTCDCQPGISPLTLNMIKNIETVKVHRATTDPKHSLKILLWIMTDPEKYSFTAVIHSDPKYVFCHMAFVNQELQLPCESLSQIKLEDWVLLERKYG